MQVQAFVSEGPVETLDVAVGTEAPFGQLHGLARLSSSTTVRHRKVRPVESVTLPRSTLQHSFGRPIGSLTSRGTCSGEQLDILLRFQLGR